MPRHKDGANTWKATSQMTTETESKSKEKPYGPKFREHWCRKIMQNSKIPPRHFKVAFAISFHFNAWTGRAWPSHETLADVANVCLKTVARAVNNLEKHHHLWVRRSRNGHQTGRANEYFPRFPATQRYATVTELRDCSVLTTGQFGPRRGTEKPSQPRTEPHKESHFRTNTRDSVSTNISAAKEETKGGFRGSKEGFPHSIESPPS